MKIKEVLIWSKKLIEKKKSKSRALEAEIILAYVLKKNKEYLYTYPEKKINKKEAVKLKKLIRKRLRGWPIPYLVAEWEFFGLNFFVNPKVLIPRAETELIIEHVLENYKPAAKLQILDIGTGSGCIAVVLGKLFPCAKITAVDISAEALKIAELNAKNNKVKNINFKLSDLFSKIEGKFNLITANLPYLSSNEISEKIKYEPKLALDGGKRGLEIIKKFLIQVCDFLKPQGKIIIEISPIQKIALMKLFKKYFTGYRIEIKKDLAKRHRLVIINRE